MTDHSVQVFEIFHELKNQPKEFKKMLAKPMNSAGIYIYTSYTQNISFCKIINYKHVSRKR